LTNIFFFVPLWACCIRTKGRGTPMSHDNLPLIFVHVPKTAGTSFRNSLVSNIGHEGVLFDYGKAEKLTSKDVIQYIYKERNYNALKEHILRNKIVLLTGHFPVSKYSHFFSPSLFCTFVREPIQRVISDYNHYVRHYKYEKDILEFAQQPENKNKQSQFLEWGNYNEFGFLGLTEEYEKSLHLFNKTFDIELSVKTDNMGRENVNSIYTEKNYPIEELKKINAKDIENYEIYKSEFYKKISKK